MTEPLRCTYRLQLTPELDFAAALELVPYLRDLGVSHLYLSPSLQATPGSTHGYDVVDPTRISDELGGEDAFRALAGAGLGVVLDVVPNHMGIEGGHNRFWEDEAERATIFDVDPETGFARRFFDIDTLVGVRQEDPDVFALTHAKPLQLVREGVVDGLRIDHPDGMADPAGYLRRLREAGVEHVWVEKILHGDEPLRDWPVSGTVGYEFLNDVCALYVDPAGEHPLSALWAELSGDDRAFAAVALEAQLEQAEGTFDREVGWLERLAGGRFAPHVLAEALARLPVYRTYVEPWSGRVAAEDRRAVGEAELPPELERVLLLEERSDELDDFVTRFQQTSSPVTAKGTEDTAFYRYHRLVALNEVGGDPGRFGLSVADFHAAQVARAAAWPEAMLTTQTHDTKRSGDARARVGALAGMAPAWEAFVRGQVATDGEVPAEEQLLTLQAIVAAQPLTRERLDLYLEKALREGKRTTNWIDPDLDHERAVQQWAWDRAQDPAVVAFCAEVAVEGERAALGQTLLKLCSPGVSDIYNGDELLTFSLVDPDNRRPVDWAERRRVLDAARAGEAPTRETAKLHLVWRALELKARRWAAFAPGATYRPVAAGDGVCAFVRGDGVLVVAPLRDWADATLEVADDLADPWRCVLTGREHELAPGALVADLVAEPYGLALLERV